MASGPPRARARRRVVAPFATRCSRQFVTNPRTLRRSRSASSRPGGRRPDRMPAFLVHPVIDQTQQPAGLVALPTVLDRAGRHRMSGGDQLGSLGPFPLGQRMQLRVIVTARQRIRRGVGGQAVHQFQDVSLPPHRLLDRRSGQYVQCRDRWHRRTCTPIQQREILISLQHRQSHRRDHAARVGQPHQRPGQSDHRAHRTLRAHPITRAQHLRPARRAHYRSPPTRRTRVQGWSGSATRSATNSRRHNK